MERKAKPELDAVRSTEWFEQAECLSHSPDLFSDSQPGSQSSAKKICRDCSVRVECLSYALKMGERHGVWGGFTDRERQSLPTGYSTVDVAREAIRREVARRESGDALVKRQNERRKSGRR